MCLIMIISTLAALMFGLLLSNSLCSPGDTVTGWHWQQLAMATVVARRCGAEGTKGLRVFFVEGIKLMVVVKGGEVGLYCSLYVLNFQSINIDKQPANLLF